MTQHMKGVIYRTLDSYALPAGALDAVQSPTVAMGLLVLGSVVFSRMRRKGVALPEISVPVLGPLLEDICTICVSVLTRDHLGCHAMFVRPVRMCPMQQKGENDRQMTMHACKVEGGRTGSASDNQRWRAATVLVCGIPTRESVGKMNDMWNERIRWRVLTSERSHLRQTRSTTSRPGRSLRMTPRVGVVRRQGLN